MSTQPNASATTHGARVVTLRVHGLSTLVARTVWISEEKRDAINAIRVPIGPDATPHDVAQEIEDRVGAILTPRRREFGNAIRVHALTVDRVMERPATRASEVGAADGVHGYLLFGGLEIGVIRVIPDPDVAADDDDDLLPAWINGGVSA